MNDLNESIVGYNTYASSSANGGEGWSPIGNSTNPFRGNLDGQNHTISGIYISRSGDDYQGLFGYIGDDGVVAHLAVENVNITGNDYVGGLAGYNNGTVSYVYSKGIVSGSSYVGGLVGSDLSLLSYSYSTVDVSGTDYVGGLLGSATGSIVNNTYSAGSVSGSSDVGGLIGSSTGSVITASFYDTNTSGQNDTTKGTPKTTVEMMTHSTFASSGWNILYISGSVGHYPKLAFEDGGISENWFVTQAPTEIYTWYDLYEIHLHPEYTYIYKLMNNIGSGTSGYDTYASALANGGSGWTSIGNSTNKFNGIFDGQGYNISDLYINRGGETYLGLFGYVNLGAVVKNLNVENVSVVGNQLTAGIAGYNMGNIYACHASGVATASQRVGLITGEQHNLGVINETSATGNVTTSGSSASVFCGLNRGKIYNSYVWIGSVTGGNYMGGLVGYNYGMINNSYSLAYVGAGSFTGGLVGRKDASSLVYDSVYDTDTSTMVDNDGRGVPKTTEEMQTITTFTDIGWDIVLIGNHNGSKDIALWFIDNSTDYPKLWYEYLDIYPPIIYVESPVNTTYTSLSIPLAFNLNEIGYTWYSLNGGANTTATNTSLTVQIGQNHIVLWANDTDGNENYTETYFFVDDSSPNITIYLPQSVTYSILENVYWNVSAFDVLTNVSSICLSTDDNLTYPTCVYSTNWFTGYSTSMSEGSHTWYFRANDTTGNYVYESVTFNALFLNNVEGQLAEAGAGLGSFLSQITNPVVEIMLGLGIISGVLVILYGLVGAFRNVFTRFL
jgi:hypothetical protein